MANCWVLVTTQPQSSAVLGYIIAMTIGLPFVIKVTSVTPQRFTSWCTNDLTMCEFVAKAGRVGYLYTPTVPAHSFHPISNRLRNRHWDLSDEWCVSSWWPHAFCFSFITYVIYTLHIVVFTLDKLPCDVFVPGFAIMNNGPNAWKYGLPFRLINILT